jgi:hypothetical protein
MLGIGLAFPVPEHQVIALDDPTSAPRNRDRTRAAGNVSKVFRRERANRLRINDGFDNQKPATIAMHNVANFEFSDPDGFGVH